MALSDGPRRCYCIYLQAFRVTWEKRPDLRGYALGLAVSSLFVSRCASSGCVETNILNLWHFFFISRRKKS